MGKGKTAAAGIAVSIGGGLVVYLLLQLLLAMLAVKGIVPERQVGLLQIFCGGLASLLGGLWAVGMVSWRPLPAALATAMGIALSAALGGVLLYDGISLTADSLARVGAMLAGGLAAALLRGGKAGGGKRKKKTVRSGRRKG